MGETMGKEKSRLTVAIWKAFLLEGIWCRAGRIGTGVQEWRRLHHAKGSSARYGEREEDRTAEVKCSEGQQESALIRSLPCFQLPS